MTSSPELSELTLTPDHYALLAVADRIEGSEMFGHRVANRTLALEAFYFMHGDEHILTREESEANYERLYPFIVDLEQAGYFTPGENHVGAGVVEITQAGRRAFRAADISAAPYELSFEYTLNNPGLTRSQVEQMRDELHAAAQKAIDDLLARKVAEMAAPSSREDAPHG